MTNKRAVIFKDGDRVSFKTYASVNGAVRAILRKPRTERWEAWDASGEHLKAWIAGDGHVYRAIATGGSKRIA